MFRSAGPSYAIQVGFGIFPEELEGTEDLSELQAVVARRIRYYNHERRHSSLGNRSPMAFLSLAGGVENSQS